MRRKTVCRDEEENRVEMKSRSVWRAIYVEFVLRILYLLPAACLQASMSPEMVVIVGDNRFVTCKMTVERDFLCLFVKQTCGLSGYLDSE
jgi:hypothetical protein